MPPAGGTVLHWAAASGNTDMLAFLLERAVNPNMQSYAGQTPLQVAAGRGHDACLRLLLSENAQPDLGDHPSQQQAGSGWVWTNSCPETPLARHSSIALHIWPEMKEASEASTYAQRSGSARGHSAA